MLSHCGKPQMFTLASLNNKTCCRRARLCTPSRQPAQSGRPRPEEISQVFPVQELRRVINSPDEGTFSQPVTQQWLLRVHDITAKTLMCLMRSSLNEFLMIMSIQTFILDSYQTVALCFLQLHWLILNQSVILNVGQTKKKNLLQPERLISVLLFYSFSICSNKLTW